MAGGVCFSEQQKAEIAYFKANLDSWLANPLYRGKYAIIYDNELVGIYDEFGSAFVAAEKSGFSGDYIIQQLISPDDTIGFYYPVLA
jgi:hypothetical protein